ncbi:MAG TPA: hypothetical protein VJP79_10475 [Nitrososphaera sp.]|nr:hypothetical protein [Nitrososphaera sp.]
MLLKIISLAALAVAVVVVAVIFSSPAMRTPGTPDVRFTNFTPDRTEIRVGESANIIFNVQSREQGVVNDSKVMIVIEPDGYQPYISVSDPVVELPAMLAKDARTGEQSVRIHVNGLPAKEATYDVKGVLLVDGKQSDIRQFEMRVVQ